MKVYIFLSLFLSLCLWEWQSEVGRPMERFKAKSVKNLFCFVGEDELAEVCSCLVGFSAQLQSH